MPRFCYLFYSSESIYSCPLFCSKPDEDTKENSIANDTFEENIQIEIEPVDDKEEEDNLNESLKSAENSVDVN